MHCMNFVIKSTEIPVRDMWYLSHMKKHVDPECVSSQCSLGREVVLCPPLGKRAVPFLLVLKNSVLLNTKVRGC